MNNNFFKRASDAAPKEGEQKKEYVVRQDRGDDRGGFKRRDDDRGGFKRRDDDRGGFKRRDDDRGGFKRRDDDRDGFKRRDDDRGGFKRRDDDRGGFKRRDDDRGEKRGGFVRGGDRDFKKRDDSKTGFKRRDDDRGGFGGGGFKKRDDDRGGFGGGGFKKRDDDRGGFKRRDDDRGGFKRRDDDRDGFKRRDDDRGGFKRRDDDRGGFKPRGDFKPKNDDKFRPKTDAGRAEQRAAERAERKVPENIIFGIHPIREALEAGGKLDKIYIIKEPNESLRTIESMALDLKIPVQNVPTVKLDKLSKNNNHQGVVATLAQVEYAELDEILAKEPTLLLVLDGVTDVRNFGAIARSAECAGVDAIIVGAKNGAQINGEAIKSSAGALLKIPVCRVGSLRLAVEAIKGQGIEPVAATEKSATPIYDVEMSSPVAIVMGAEDKGISSDILKLCDRRGAVPTTGTIESLNVSAAAAVILFEAVRQRL